MKPALVLSSTINAVQTSFCYFASRYLLFTVLFAGFLVQNSVKKIYRYVEVFFFPRNNAKNQSRVLYLRSEYPDPAFLTNANPVQCFFHSSAVMCPTGKDLFIEEAMLTHEKKQFSFRPGRG
jgi:hypothetical protein